MTWEVGVVLSGPSEVSTEMSNPKCFKTLKWENTAQDPGSCPGLVRVGLQVLESLSTDGKNDLASDSV